LNKEVTVRFGKLKNAAVEFDVLTTCQPSTVWCSRERLSAAAAQPTKVRQSCSDTDYYYYIELRGVGHLQYHVSPLSRKFKQAHHYFTLDLSFPKNN
jgi:hypothetical protein